MSEQSLEQTTEVTDTSTQSQAPAEKFYTQEEFDRHMAGMKASLQKKYEKTLSELGDINELRQIKADYEKKKTEESVKRGEFEKVLQDLAAKKDAEIQRRDAVIREYRVDTPLLNAAAKLRAVAPEQVKALLKSQVRLNDDGDVEVVDHSGQVLYNDKGVALGVDDLVQDFLQKNPHFVQPMPATTNSRSNISNVSNGKIDISKLDMKNAADRQLYKEYMAQHKN